MNMGATRYRLSILAFEQASSFWRAAHELLLHGFNTTQFCLFGLPFVIEEQKAPPAKPLALAAELNGLLATPPTRVRLTSTDIFEMRCGELAERLFTHSEPGIVEASWMRPDLARTLVSDVASGCLVLLVTSITADQHALGARLLLRHGDRNLQTNEFSMPIEK